MKRVVMRLVPKAYHPNYVKMFTRMEKLPRLQLVIVLVHSRRNVQCFLLLLLVLLLWFANHLWCSVANCARVVRALWPQVLFWTDQHCLHWQQLTANCSISRWQTERMPARDILSGREDPWFLFLFFLPHSKLHKSRERIGNQQSTPVKQRSPWTRFYPAINMVSFSTGPYQQVGHWRWVLR